MRGRTGVLFALVVWVGAAIGIAAQETRPSEGAGRAGGFQLEQNYPNPFNPETTIPFVLGDELFVEGRPATVSLRIFNIVQQLVAVPVALRHPSGEGVPVLQLEYALPGRYEAFWDGTDPSGRQVASGIYFMQLTVNGLSTSRKMYVLK
jgi:hypothetical protein